MTKKRAIFEDVSDKAEYAKPAVTPGGIDRGRTGARGAVRIWILLIAALLVLMIVVGGLTRLTDSGLAITEWAPVTGAIPPTNAEMWESEFEKYRAIPEYQLQNKGMSLTEFKTIYWWEWGHRQLGRVIGLVWAVGFLFFLVTRRIPPGWTGRLILLGGLGGLQGVIGWWMVSSGLSGGMLDVASYRLATHLGLAFVILGFITWYAMALSRPERDLMQARRASEGRLMQLGTILAVFAFVQILLGALVAGIDAGRNYTDWPLMAGGFLPPDLFELVPWWRNFFEDDGLVQFTHRMTAYVLFAFGVFVGMRAAKSAFSKTRGAFGLVGILLVGQMVVGVATVMYSAPWQIAIVHQFLAILLWVAIIRGRFLAGYPVAGSVREGV